MRLSLVSQKQSSVSLWRIVEKEYFFKDIVSIEKNSVEKNVISRNRVKFELVSTNLCSQKQESEEVQETEIREPPPSRPKSSPLDHQRVQYVQGKS